jgi:hypothetical protein
MERGFSVRIKKDHGDRDAETRESKRKSVMDSPKESDNISMKSGLSAFTHRKVMKQ